MAPFPQNRSCGRETPCKSSFPLWHGRPVHRLHRRDNENRKGEAGASLHAAARAYRPGGRAVLFAIHDRFFVARSPVFLHRPALWQQREGIRRIFDTPSTSSSARGKKGGTGALSTCIIPKCAPLVKKKEGRTAVLPPSYAPARRDIQGPRFSPAAPKVGLSGKCPAGVSLMPGCAGWRPAPPPPAPDGSGSGPEWPPPAYGGLRG